MIQQLFSHSPSCRLDGFSALAARPTVLFYSLQNPRPSASAQCTCNPSSDPRQRWLPNLPYMRYAGGLPTVSVPPETFAEKGIMIYSTKDGLSFDDVKYLMSKVDLDYTTDDFKVATHVVWACSYTSSVFSQTGMAVGHLLAFASAIDNQSGINCGQELGAHNPALSTNSAQTAGKLDNVCSAKRSREEVATHATITYVAVDPAVQAHGLGRSVVEHLLVHLMHEQGYHAVMLRSVSKAVNFYSKLGFLIVTDAL